MSASMGISAALFVMLAVAAQDDVAGVAVADRVLEIRSYTLRSGTRDDFHRRFVREVLPLLQRWSVDVVAFGPSLHDGDSYFLMRVFPSLAGRAQRGGVLCQSRLARRATCRGAGRHRDLHDGRRPRR
jgi:hypothetical protein